MNFTHGVLVVDDDPVHQFLSESALNALGVRHVHKADEGEDAVAFLEKCEASIGLIVLDLSMPKMSGQSFLAHLKEMEYQGHIIICSSEEAVSRDIAERLAIWCGLKIVGTLPKPMTLDGMYEMLQLCITGSAEDDGTEVKLSATG